MEGLAPHAKKTEKYLAHFLSFGISDTSAPVTNTRRYSALISSLRILLQRSEDRI